MANNKLQIMLSFMKELEKGNVPKASDYSITQQEYCEIAEACQDDGYIKGCIFTRGGQGNKVLVAYLENAKLTVKGMQYIQENS